MGRKSIKDSKSVYQQCRESLGLSRDKASELMTSISASRIEKIESGIPATPYDIIQMADCYHKPELCNYFCSHECEIGARYVPEVKVTELPSIILETIASLNAIHPLTNRLIEISRDGKITDDEIPDFARIQHMLNEISLAVDSLTLWVDKTVSENEINQSLLMEAVSQLS